MPVMPSMTYIAAWVGNFGIQFQPNIQRWICLMSGSRVLFNMEKKKRSSMLQTFFKAGHQKVSTLNPQISGRPVSLLQIRWFVGWLSSCWNSEGPGTKGSQLGGPIWQFSCWVACQDSVGWLAVPYTRYQLLH